MRIHSAALIAALCTTTQAHAQIVYGGQGRWWWEASTDNGTTFSERLLEVPQAPTNVLVRLRFSFPSGHLRYLGGAGMDAAVYNTAPGDDISDVTAGDRNGGERGLIYRIPRLRLIKIDTFGDDLPPGEGPEWLCICQHPPQTFPTPSFNNPITAMTYRLHLDGTPGDRQVSAVIASYMQVGHLVSAYTHSLNPPERSTTFYLSTIQDPLTIRVVPTPAGMFGLFGLMLCAVRRQRTSAVQK